MSIRNIQADIMIIVHILYKRGQEDLAFLFLDFLRKSKSRFLGNKK